MINGYLEKLGGGAVPRLQRRYFVLKGDSLYYAEREDETVGAKGELLVRGCRILDRGNLRGKSCLSLVSHNTTKGIIKEYYLFTESSAEKRRWLSALMIASGQYPFMTHGSTASSEVSMARLQSSPLYSVLQVPTNQWCADCRASRPTWVVLEPFGVVVCIECVGVHRGLWPHRCREVQLDTFPNDQVDYLASRGNAQVNAELEFHVPIEMPKPAPTSPAELRRAYIEAKYRREFVRKEGLTAQPPISASVKVPSGLYDGSPKYIGILHIREVELEGVPPTKGVLMLCNGFQEVRSGAGEPQSGSGGVTRWGDTLQLGVIHIEAPLTLSVVEKDTVVATAEVAVNPAGGSGTHVALMTTDPTVMFATVSFTDMR